MAQINKPNLYFNTKLYTGNSSTQSITGVGFQPDLVWIKSRSVAEWHQLHDSVRGVAKYFFTNSTSGDNERDPNDQVTSFDSNGFSLGAAANDSVNTNSATYVAWNWLADNTSGSSNTDGSITSTVSANTTSGFSIVSYTGTGSNATVGHGLGSIPKMIIVKRRSGADPWRVQHGSLGSQYHLILNETNASATGTNVWNDTEPTSSVFTISTDRAVNGSGDTFIAYCFAEKKGFSKFGSYTGNGNNDGAFIYTGFKPAFVINKIYSGTTSSWNIFDNKRDGFNDQNKQLYADLSNAEASGGKIDLLSNGFKVRSSSDEVNGSGYGYIYMAFAENPLVGTNNIPATAR